MKTSYLRRVYLRLAGVVMLAVTLALAANGFLSHRSFEQALMPEMTKKVSTVGASIGALVVKAVDNGIAFDGLYGVEQKFAEIDQEIREITYFAITDTRGRVLYEHPRTSPAQASRLASADALRVLGSAEHPPVAARVGSHHIVSMPLFKDAQPLGVLHLGVDVGFIDNLVLEMLLDVLVVLVVSLFFTLELLHFMAGSRIEVSLGALGSAFERGAHGDFARPRKQRADLGFAPVIERLEGVLERVNAAYQRLAADVEAARRSPAHERPPGLAVAQARLQSLASRFRFGQAPEARPGADGELGKVRAPLFVFILAEELTRSFLPGYVKELLVPLPGMSPQIVLGLPIALFMLIVAIGQPYFGVLAERWGHRKTMLVGASVAAVGFAASALAVSVVDLLLWRSLCAVGYAMVFVSAQAYVLEHSGAGSRASSFSVFIGAIMVATVCGPSIGGILADNLGERWTFGVAAGLALASLLSIRQLPARRPGAAVGRPAARVPRLREIARLLGNRRFLVVTALAAMPAKILLTGLCFYLMPLYVTAEGGNQAMAGRVLMTYGVVVVLLSPVASRWATNRDRMEWLVGGGLVLSGLGGLLLLGSSGVVTLFGALALVGAGQALSMSAQSALVSEHCQRAIGELGEGAVYGVYRLLERLGNAIGPLLAAGLVMAQGYRPSFVVLGAFVSLCGIGFLLATRRPVGPVPVTA